MTSTAERFLKYVTYDTTADNGSSQIPSTSGQLVFAKELAEECRELGLSDVSVSQWGYVYACLPANTDKPAPTIGFIAHMDTSEDCSGKAVSARIIKTMTAAISP